MNLLKLLTRDKWEVRRTIWPYRDGWGVYNPGTRTILDTGLTKERAQHICDEMNKEALEGKK